MPLAGSLGKRGEPARFASKHGVIVTLRYGDIERADIFWSILFRA